MRDKNYEYPDWVKLGLISGTLVYLCVEQNYLVENLPSCVQSFIKDHPEQPAHDWAQKLMESSLTMPLDELEKWLQNMSSGMFRAEMRAVFKQRKDMSELLSKQ